MIKTLDPLWVSAFVTFVLVCITGYYALETRRIRIGAVKPLFSLRTGFPIRGEPLELYLMNNGGLAKDVKIDVFLNKVLKHNYYLASISTPECKILPRKPSPDESFPLEKG